MGAPAPPPLGAASSYYKLWWDFRWDRWAPQGAPTPCFTSLLFCFLCSLSDVPYSPFLDALEREAGRFLAWFWFGQFGFYDQFRWFQFQNGSVSGSRFGSRAPCVGAHDDVVYFRTKSHQSERYVIVLGPP